MTIQLGNEIKVVDRLGNATLTEYDNNGNVTRVTDANSNTTRKVYNEMDLVVEEIDALGNTTSYEYDLMGNLIKETDALGNITTSEYDELNRVVSEVDALNYANEITYNSINQVASVVRRDGVVEEYSYDKYGNEVERYVDGVKVESTEYDARGNLIEEIDANKNITEYAYDKKNRLVETIYASGNKEVTTYDKYGNVIKLEDSLGVIEESTYDNHHRKLTTTDALGDTTKYYYEEKGSNVVKVEDSKGNSELTEYDILDRVVKSTSKTGVVVETIYDSVGNVIETKRDSVSAYSEYDANYNVVKEIDRLGKTIEYEYDSLNQLVVTTDANGNEHTTEYDELGREVVKSLNGEEIETIKYDAINAIEVTEGGLLTTKYQYDNYGNVVKTQQNDELITIYDYDLNGNLIKTSKNGVTIQEYKYDNMNNMLEYVNSEEIEHYYEYDKRGNVVKQINNDKSEVILEYDNASNNTKTTTDDKVIESTYNKQGLLTSSVLIEEDSELVTELEYDGYNRVVEVTDSNDNTVSYSYDEYGNRVNLNYSDSSSQSYVYNDVDVIESVVTRDGITIDYTYDDNYNMTSEKYSNGVESSYTYTDDNRVEIIEYSDTSGVIDVSSYTYDEIGRVVEVNREVEDIVVNKSYTYDSSNQIESAVYDIEVDGRSEYIKYEYEYDKLNNRSLETVNKNGEITKTVEVTNNAGQIISRDNGETKVKYDYDNNGNLVREDDGDLEITYEYDGLNKLVSTTHNDRLFEEYYYDGLGSRIGKTTYEYYDYHKVSARETTLISLEGNLEKRIENSDFVCKTTEISTLETELAEGKQCGGISDATDINAIEVEYVNDLTYENELVLEVKEDSDIYNTYIYNRPVTSTLNEEIEVNVLSHTNSVNARIGEEVIVHEYEVNGKELEVVNDFEIVNEIGYNGEVEDNSDLQYLRARYYNQDNARFISEDNYLGEIGRGQSHNSYIYVENNGVNYKDPSGNSAASVYWPGVVHRGPGYIVVGDPNNYTVKITNLREFNFNGGFTSYALWNMQQQSKKAEQEAANEAKYEEEFNTSAKYQDLNNSYSQYRSWGLEFTDPQFFEKAVMCDSLDSYGLTDDEIRDAIQNYSLSELEEFLNSGLSWSEWQELNSESWIEKIRTPLEILQWILAIGGFVVGIIFPGVGDIVFDLLDLLISAILGDILGIVIGIIALAVVAISALAFKGFKSVDSVIGKAKELFGNVVNTVINFITDIGGKIVSGLRKLAKQTSVFIPDFVKKGADALSGIADNIFIKVKNIFAKSGNRIGVDFDNLYSALKAKEKKIVDGLLSDGKSVELMAENAQGGKMFDALVDGIPTEFKTLTSDVVGNAAKTVKKAYSQLPNNGKGGQIIVDLSASSLSPEDLLNKLARDGYDISIIVFW